MTRERPAVRRRGLRWDERSLLPRRAGVQWWLAVCLALALTAVGSFADIQRLDRLGLLFQACYFLGCLLAVTLVQRKGLFGPMVQPPLILALAVPGVVLIAGSVPSSGGATATALAVGTPLINGFPTMAITTGLTLAVGAFRIRTERAPLTQDSPSPSGRNRESVRASSRSRAREVARETDIEPRTEPILRMADDIFPRFENRRPRRL